MHSELHWYPINIVGYVKTLTQVCHAVIRFWECWISNMFVILLDVSRDCSLIMGWGGRQAEKHFGPHLWGSNYFLSLLVGSNIISLNYAACFPHVCAICFLSPYLCIWICVCMNSCFNLRDQTFWTYLVRYQNVYAHLGVGQQMLAHLTKLHAGPTLHYK